MCVCLCVCVCVCVCVCDYFTLMSFDGIPLACGMRTRKFTFFPSYIDKRNERGINKTRQVIHTHTHISCNTHRRSGNCAQKIRYACVSC